MGVKGEETQGIDRGGETTGKRGNGERRPKIEREIEGDR